MPTGLQVIADYITPQLQFTVQNVEGSIKAVEKKLNVSLRTIAMDAWIRGQHTWKPLSPETIKRKGHAVKLLDTGVLYANLQKASYESVKVYRKSRTDIMVEIDLSKQFITSPYIGFHEMGTKKMPDRKIFTDETTIRQFQIKLQELGVPGLIARECLLAKPPFKAPPRTMTRPDLGYFPQLAFLLPLGTFFKYMGLYADIEGIFAGSILQPQMLRAYFKMFFLARAGMPTPKVLRRKLRREIWR